MQAPKKENCKVPRTAKSQISFADWELLRQGLSLEPFLQTISVFWKTMKR